MSWDDDLRAAAQDMLDLAGVEAATAYGSLQVLFQAPGQVIDLANGQVVTENPVAMAFADDVNELEIAGGQSGTAITINDTDYVVRSVVPDGNYFVRLTLEAA